MTKLSSAYFLYCYVDYDRKLDRTVLRPHKGKDSDKWSTSGRHITRTSSQKGTEMVDRVATLKKFISS